MVFVLGFAKTICSTISIVGPYVSKTAKMEHVTRKPEIVMDVCKVFMVRNAHHGAMEIVSKIHVDGVMDIVHTHAQNVTMVQLALQFVVYIVATAAIDRQAFVMPAQRVVMVLFAMKHAQVLVHPVSVKKRMETVLVHVSQDIMATTALLSAVPHALQAVTKRLRIALATA